MHGRPIRTSSGSEPHGSALVYTGPKILFIRRDSHNCSMCCLGAQNNYNEE